MVVGVRVEAENVTSGEVKHCNSSYFTMVAKDNEGKNIPVPGLILKDAPSVRRYARSLERKASAFDRDSKYDAKRFVVQEHLEKFKGENVQLDLK